MKSNRSTPTLDDVARSAGVSTATVSRCLNAPDRVLKSTRERVQQAIDALGYTPNFGARVMAAKRTFTIGAIIPTMENAIFARGLQAFQETLHALGYTLLVSSSSYRPDVEHEQIRALVARGADGLLLIGYERDPAIYEYLKRQGVPVLVAWAFTPDAAQISIGFDNYLSMRALAEKVAEFGHRRIGVISAMTAGNDRASQRLQAIQDVFVSGGATVLVDETPYGIENGAAAFERLMSDELPPSVVICGNDVLAVGALGRARKMGFDVPGDVSITGFDDIELAQVVTPALTTVHVPHRKMGREAAKVLVSMVENKKGGTSVQLESSLMLRASLGPVQS
jgi:LacI family transcriptional regulator